MKTPLGWIEYSDGTYSVEITTRRPRSSELGKAGGNPMDESGSDNADQSTSRAGGLHR